MFQVKVVQNCPVTRGSTGRIRIKPWVLAELRGALLKEEYVEWAVLLTGERSTDGMDVQVTGLRVPEQQVRSAASVNLPLMELPEDCVGVLHSHHTMGAFFSSTDVSTLNPRFPVSIVIANLNSGSRSLNGQGGRISTDHERWFGFDYQAVGRVILPCGALGVVHFNVELLDEAGEWRWVEDDWGWISLKEPGGYMGDCPSREPIEESRLYIRSKGACGIQGEASTRIGVFGEGESIVGMLPKPEISVTYPSRGGFNPHGYWITLGPGHQQWVAKGSSDYDPIEHYGSKGKIAGEGLRPETLADRNQRSGFGKVSIDMTGSGWQGASPSGNDSYYEGWRGHDSYGDGWEEEDRADVILAMGAEAWADLTSDQQEQVIKEMGFGTVDRIGDFVGETIEEREAERQFWDNYERLQRGEIVDLVERRQGAWE